MLNNAKKLRSNQTPAESLLWYYLRARRFVGYKFKRQVPLGNYIVDFICYKERLIIEIDGGQHGEQIEYDLKRTRWLNHQGFRVKRYCNNEVLFDVETVLDDIFYCLKESPSPAGRGNL